MMRACTIYLAVALAGCGGGDGDGHSTDLASGGSAADLGAAAGDDLATWPGAGGDLADDAGITPAPCSYDESADGTARLLAVYTLPVTSLQLLNPFLTEADLDAALTNGALTTTDPGLGSGLEYGGGCPGTFYLITDRGINGDRTAGDGKTFPLPAFTPTITTTHGAGDALVLDAVLPIRNRDGNPVSGLSNDAADDVAWLTDSATTPLPLDPDGFDTEDLRRLPDSDFAFSDEYTPSVGIIDGSTGKVKVRYVPAGVTSTARYPVKAILPAVLTNRRINKGLEGLALSPDGHTAWTVLQTPMGDDGTANYGNSLVNRVVRIDNFDDPDHAVVGGHYLVLHQTAASLIAGGKQKNVFFNSATYVAPNKLLLLERISNPTANMAGRLTLVVADFTTATNLVGHPELGEGSLDPEKPTPPGYQALNLTPATVTTVFDSNDVPALFAIPTGGAMPDKLEGLAVINKTTFALANDNDFGIINPQDRSRVWVLRTKAPMY